MGYCARTTKRSFFCTRKPVGASSRVARSALRSASTCQPFRAPCGHREVDLMAAPPYTRADPCVAGLRRCSVPVFIRGLTSRPSINAAPLWPGRSG